MPRADLSTIAQFVTVARHRNFRRAAAELALSPSTLSERIRTLEDGLGVRLFNRSTRSTSLTEEGRQFLDRVGDAVAVLGDAVDEAGSRGAYGALTGVIRINGPAPALELCLMPLIASFVADNPGVRVEAIAEANFVDVVEQGYDAGVRYDESLADDMVAISLGGQQRMVLAGSPDYLDCRGRPLHPRDLAAHDCITHVFVHGNVLPWSFSKGDEAMDVKPDGHLRVNSGELALIAARAGAGLAFTFEDYVERDVAEGRLARVLEDWTPPFPAPSLYFTERRLMPAAFRAFVDHVKRHARASRNAPAAPSSDG